MRKVTLTGQGKNRHKVRVAVKNLKDRRAKFTQIQVEAQIIAEEEKEDKGDGNANTDANGAMPVIFEEDSDNDEN